MDTCGSGRGGPGDHNYFGPPRPQDDPRQTDDEQLNQDDQPLQLTVELKRRGPNDQDDGEKPRYYKVHIADWRSSKIVYKKNVPDDERPSTSFANPAPRYLGRSATQPDPEPLYYIVESDEPIASTSAGPTYITARAARPAMESVPVLIPQGAPANPRKENPGSKPSTVKSRWLRRRLEETRPLQKTVYIPVPSTSSSSAGPQSNTVNVSTQVEYGELGNITYEDQIEEQIESRKCSLCQATNYCRKKCSMRGKHAHGMWCLHGIVFGNELNGRRSPQLVTVGTSNSTVDQNRNTQTDMSANNADIQTPQDYSIPSTSSGETHHSGSHHPQKNLYYDSSE